MFHQLSSDPAHQILIKVMETRTNNHGEYSWNLHQLNELVNGVLLDQSSRGSEANSLLFKLVCARNTSRLDLVSWNMEKLNQVGEEIQKYLEDVKDALGLFSYVRMFNTEELETQFQEALDLIREGATLFRSYERSHRDKAGAASSTSSISDHVSKAEVNNQIATKFEEFLHRGMRK